MSTEKQRPRFKNTIHLWEFLLELLNNERYASIISWTKRENGEFKLKKQEEVARQWGLLKQRKGMTYDKLSRSLRYYYDKKIIQKVSGQRLVYRFRELPFEYLPLRNMDEKTRRRQLQTGSSVMISTDLNSSCPPSLPSSTKPAASSPVDNGRSIGNSRELSVICQVKANQIQNIEARDNMMISFPTSQVISRSRIIFPSCGYYVMVGSHVMKP